MKLRVGQKVMVRPDLNGDHAYKAGLTIEMKKMRGKVVTIRKVEDLGYWTRVELDFKDDPNNFSWQVECFLPIELSEDELFEQLVVGHLDDEEYKKILDAMKDGVI